MTVSKKVGDPYKQFFFSGELFCTNFMSVLNIGGGLDPPIPSDEVTVLHGMKVYFLLYIHNEWNPYHEKYRDKNLVEV